MKTTDTKRKIMWSAIGLAAAAVGYLFVLRPKHLRWGTSEYESTEPLPGDDLVPEANSATHAITIYAPPEDVWPWIAQIGRDKAGFYSYSFLENLVGCDLHNADEIHPEWQGVHEGDSVMFHPKFPGVPVRSLQEGKHLVLGAELDGPNASSWAFVIRDWGNGTTRLIVRLRTKPHKGAGLAADLFFLEPAHFVMERKMMLTVKRLAERRAKPAKAA